MKLYKYVGNLDRDLRNICNELHQAARNGCLIVAEPDYTKYYWDKNWQPLSRVERLIYSRKWVTVYEYDNLTFKFVPREVRVLL